MSDWAYLAGILDGEGTICVTLDKRGHLFTEVSVGNTSRPLIDWLQDRWPGVIKYRPPAKSHHRDFWIWRLHGQSAVPVLEGALPYLVVKCEQAALFLELFRLVQFGHRTPSGRAQDRLDLVAQIRVLNKRGVA